MSGDVLVHDWLYQITEWILPSLFLPPPPSPFLSLSLCVSLIFHLSLVLPADSYRRYPPLPFQTSWILNPRTFVSLDSPSLFLPLPFWFSYLKRGNFHSFLILLWLILYWQLVSWDYGPGYYSSNFIGLLLLLLYRALELLIPIVLSCQLTNGGRDRVRFHHFRDKKKREREREREREKEKTKKGPSKQCHSRLCEPLSLCCKLPSVFIRL